MQNILRGSRNTLCFQDDVLVYGTSKDEHDELLRVVLTKLRDSGLTIKKDKCQLGVRSVEYLGHTISKEGFKPKTSLVDAVAKAPQPQNKDELKSFLGLAEFMCKYVRNFAQICGDLHEL